VSYKLGFILTLTFVMQILILGGDIYALQLVHAYLDAIAQTTGFRIAQAGRADDGTIAWLADRDVAFTCLLNCVPRFGDTMEFRLTTAYDPLILSPEPLSVSVVRMTVIGYYI